MIHTATWRASQASRKELSLSGGGIVWLTDFLAPSLPQPGAEIFPLPQALTAEQSARAVSLPHYHDEDQFQVIISGGGMLGRHAVRPWTVHYSNRQTGYGPITAGDDGLTYFTLRQIVTKGTWYVHDSKGKQDRMDLKRQITSEPVERFDERSLKALAVPAVATLIEPQPDGLAAWVTRVPPHTSEAAPVTSNGTGRFFLVLGGTLRVGNESLPPLSIAFVSHDESNFELKADNDGVEVMVLQYPGGERVLRRKARPAAEQGPLPARP